MKKPTCLSAAKTSTPSISWSGKETSTTYSDLIDSHANSWQISMQRLMQINYSTCGEIKPGKYQCTTHGTHWKNQRYGKNMHRGRKSKDKKH